MDLSRYLDIFITDSHEHLASAADLVPRLEDPGSTAETVRELFRHAHSIKGMSATMGYAQLTDVAHAAEELLAAFRADRLRPDDAHVRLLLEAIACMERMIDSLEAGNRPEDDRASAIAARLRTSADADPATPRGASEARHESEPAREGHPEPEVRGGAWRLDLRLAPGGAVAPANVASLLNRLGELGAVRYTTASADYHGTDDPVAKLIVLFETEHDRSALQEALESAPEIARFSLAREPTVAPAPERSTQSSPWTRVRADLVDHVIESTMELMLEHDALAAETSSLLDDAGHARLQRARVLLRDLHARTLELRLVPFETIAYRLSRTVRELGSSLGKPARFEMTGRDVRLDRSLLEALLDPLTHLIRNSLDHGLESPVARREAGKEASGTIRVAVEQRGDRTVIAVSDDGRGLDAAALVRSAVDRGFISEDDAERLGEIESLMLITLPGFSTVDRPGPVSGRGVGMDVARTEIESLGGTLQLASEPGRGTRVELSVPSTRAVVQTLLVRSAGELYAVPVEAVSASGRVDPDSLVTAETGLCMIDGPQRIPARALDGGAPRPGVPSWSLVVEGEGGPVALLVDDVVGRRELLVEPLDAALQRLGAFNGAAVLRDGTVVLVLDPSGIVDGPPAGMARSSV
jgi:two-component system chemotaxis sensor kinase CheA